MDKFREQNEELSPMQVEQEEEIKNEEMMESLVDEDGFTKVVNKRRK